MTVCNYLKGNYRRFSDSLLFKSIYNSVVDRPATSSKYEKSQKIIRNLYTQPEGSKKGAKGQQKVPDYLVGDHPTEIP